MQLSVGKSFRSFHRCGYPLAVWRRIVPPEKRCARSTIDSRLAESSSLGRPVLAKLERQTEAPPNEQSSTSPHKGLAGGDRSPFQEHPGVEVVTSRGDSQISYRAGESSMNP